MSKAASLKLYTEGRWEIDGRQLRYEAGNDICLATLRILKEYAADCESEHFVCIHTEDDGDLALVKALIEREEKIIAGELDPYAGELNTQARWLHEVADLLPRLWD